MITYEITTVTAEERAKADTDMHYIPEEEVIATIKCEDWEIAGKSSRAMRQGHFPGDAQYREAVQ